MSCLPWIPNSAYTSGSPIPGTSKALLLDLELSRCEGWIAEDLRVTIPKVPGSNPGPATKSILSPAPLLPGFDIAICDIKEGLSL